MKRCKHCNKLFEPQYNSMQPTCTPVCALAYILTPKGRAAIKESARKQSRRDNNAKHKADKERIKTRTAWYDQLQTLVNQYVVHVRDNGLPCITCGTTNDIKYDAGHWQTRAARSELRFNLYNIHKQCSVQCNQNASGAKQEHEEYISNKYGNHIVDWLKSHHHKSLKEQFPHYEDIKTEMKRYRVLLRENGLKPYA